MEAGWFGQWPCMRAMSTSINSHRVEMESFPGDGLCMEEIARTRAYIFILVQA